MADDRGMRGRTRQPRFLPISPAETEALGLSQLDVILVSGDAYVDHPSFGTAVIGRVLWDAGFSVGIIAQPDWKSDADFTRLGTPRLFFGISSGNVDSMVNHYTANLKRRSEDVYSPGGIPRRPDRAVIVYANRLHALFPDVPLVLGGIEASLRRFAHFDYWEDRVRQSILADAPGDILVFGMGERQVVALASRAAAGESIPAITDIPGTMVKREVKQWRTLSHEGYMELPSFTEISSDRLAFAQAFIQHLQEQDPVRGRLVAQPHPKTVVIQNRPAMPLTTSELDHVYELPFTRLAHPSYELPIPALEPVQFSVTSHRGCFGDCSFCALTHHQGRIVQSRSIDSIVREVRKMAKMPEYKGVVQDIGGPTANMFGLFCSRWDSAGTCPDRLCSPECPNLVTSHAAQLELLRRLRQIPGVKHVFIGSGVRYDLIPPDEPEYLAELCEHHVSGHLKVAPEHISREVTECMRKPPEEVFAAFRSNFEEQQAGKKRRQYIVPYFMSSHPGCTVQDMVALAEYIRDQRLYTEQVQDFTPTPMSASTCMYYTGINPFTMKPVHVPKGREKQIQRALLQYREKKNRPLVCEGLRQAGRSDLVGTGSRCLVAGPRDRDQ